MGRTQWAELPDFFPTHLQDAKFWEELGRVVATFGFLEEILGRAIFAHTATRPYAEEEVDAAYREWLPKLERALYDPLGKLINEYAKAVREHPDVPIQDHDLDDLIDKLRIASKNRNMLCHASWGPPDDSGASIPFYVNRKMEIFDKPIDVDFLRQTREDAAELTCIIVNTVTATGWQFPGSAGLGKPLKWRD